MKFGRSIPLLLFFGLLLPTFINSASKECDVGGKCFWYGQTTSDDIPVNDKKVCDDGICYVFKCMRADGKIMYGSGCYEDFFNTCGFIQSSIMENAKGNSEFQWKDENVIAVSCGDEKPWLVPDPNAYAKTKYMEATKKDKKWGSQHNKTKDESIQCDYESKALPPFKPQVQCAKGGYCLTGLIETPAAVYSNVTCDACATFICNVNGKLMVGSGCLNDFERICTNIPAAEMQKIKAGKNFYNYIDENNIVSSCAFGDNCQNVLAEAFYATVKEKANKIITSIPASEGEICPYDPQPPKPSEPNENGSKENGSNGDKLSGMFPLGFILFYLW
uniref:Uncharacterized protein n=1 Tax=Panagrolaimus davidi TaxID=227884 RepID=A0A914R4Z1_9BILA